LSVPGLFFDFALGVGVPFFVDFAVASSSSPDFFTGDLFGFGVGESSSSPSLAGVFFGFAFGVGVGVAFFFDFDFRVAGFGVGFGVGLSDGVGDAKGCSSSRGFFFLGSSLVWARTNAPSIPITARAVPRITRSRITGRERNRPNRAIKRAVARPRPRGHEPRRARVRGAGSRSVFRRPGAADRSTTSRSSTR
jgi:hypothetical protein